LPCRLHPARAARLIAETPDPAARRLASALGLSEYLGTPVTELSVGQQQRVAAARALIGAPELVIADEPTSALDTDRRDEFLDLLFTQCDAVGSTLLFVSHDLSLGSRFDRQLGLRELNQAGGA
jgi:putative ABC transport system ATP-binding protein